MKGRPPALTPQQQEQVRARLAAGEGVRALAAEFGVGKATIGRLAGHTGQVRKVAETLVAAQAALAELPPALQHQAVSLAEKLRSVSESIASAAVHGAETARHLHALAHAEARKVQADNLETSGDSLRAVGALTKLANDAAAIPLGMLAGTKGKGNDPPPDDLPTIIELVAPGDSSAA